MWFQLLLPVLLKIVETLMARKIVTKMGIVPQGATPADNDALLALCDKAEHELPKETGKVGAPGDGLLKRVRDFLAAVRAGDVDLALSLFVEIIRSL